MTRFAKLIAVAFGLTILGRGTSLAFAIKSQFQFLRSCLLSTSKIVGQTALVLSLLCRRGRPSGNI